MGLFPELDQVRQRSGGGSSLFPELKKPAKRSFISDLASDYKDAVVQGPAAMLAKIPETLHRISSKAGDISEEQMLIEGADPSLARGVNNTISVAPDIASLAGPFETPFRGKMAAVAEDATSHALGLTKRFRNTPFARGKIAEASKMALEEGIIPYSGNSTEMFDRASALANKSGSKIGEVLKNTEVNLSGVFDDLENVRNKITQGGLKKGIYEAANNEIDRAQNTILELTDRGDKVSAQTLNQAKAKLAKTINFFSDLASQSDKKEIVSGISNSIRGFVKNLNSPEVFSEYLANQKKYGAAMTMLTGLNNELATKGNKPVSLLSAIAATSAGGPVEYAAKLGLTEAAFRRGGGMTARLLSDLSKSRISPYALAGRLGLKKITSDRNQTDGE